MTPVINMTYGSVFLDTYLLYTSASDISIHCRQCYFSLIILFMLVFIHFSSNRFSSYSVLVFKVPVTLVCIQFYTVTSV